MQCVFLNVDDVPFIQSDGLNFSYLKVRVVLADFFEYLKAPLSFCRYQNLIAVVYVGFCLCALFKIDMVDVLFPRFYGRRDFFHVDTVCEPVWIDFAPVSGSVDV